MGHQYSLRVNDRCLGPYERRMIVGMRVKNLVANDQQLRRDDGLEMTVAELMQDRLEVKQLPALHHESSAEIPGATPSTGMWPVFLVRFSPAAPHSEAHAWGFRGQGTISYQGDELRIRAERLQANRASSPQQERLPVAFIESSMVEGTELELIIKTPQAHHPSDNSVLLRIEFESENEAVELWELLNMSAQISLN